MRFIKSICLLKIEGQPIIQKENLQDISLQSLQWLESRGLFGGGGGLRYSSNKGLNINSNSGNGSNVVTSANASGNQQLLGMQQFNDHSHYCFLKCAVRD